MIFTTHECKWHMLKANDALSNKQHLALHVQ